MHANIHTYIQHAFVQTNMHACTYRNIHTCIQADSYIINPFRFHISEMKYKTYLQVCCMTDFPINMSSNSLRYSFFFVLTDLTTQRFPSRHVQQRSNPEEECSKLFLFPIFQFKNSCFFEPGYSPS